jgi:hypothetical protein
VHAAAPSAAAPAPVSDAAAIAMRGQSQAEQQALVGAMMGRLGMA